MATKKGGDDERVGAEEPPEPLADLLAVLFGGLATRIARSAHLQAMATLVAAGHSEDNAALLASKLSDRAERDIVNVEFMLRRRDE